MSPRRAVFAELNATVNTRVGDLNTSFNARIGNVETEVRALRADVQDLGQRVSRLEVRVEAIGQHQAGAGGSVDNPD